MHKRLGIQIIAGSCGLVLAIYLMHSHPVLAIMAVCLAGFLLTERPSG